MYFTMTELQFQVNNVVYMLGIYPQLPEWCKNEVLLAFDLELHKCKIRNSDYVFYLCVLDGRFPKSGHI